MYNNTLISIECVCFFQDKFRLSCTMFLSLFYFEIYIFDINPPPFFLKRGWLKLIVNDLYDNEV